ncbi:hypothetical protein M422DRAFT_34453 [Sphaerobolus stellatus SS14]|uniref:Uncharacterized protein n=1 Tax=Sphaerobolus stellatus (strain SS14) TaxID=990650 RepID=A0A0C9V303_SPHS4|nr:hypothetical protein M422DRAFT_34453 [Sphaerobolus stellatus SS14]
MFGRARRSVPFVQLSSITGRLNRLNETIIKEFGSLQLDYECEKRRETPDQEIENSNAVNSSMDITSEEFPWAINGG